MKKHLITFLLLVFCVPTVNAQSKKTQWRRFKDRLNYEYAELNKCIRRPKECDPTRRALYIMTAIITAYLMSQGARKIYKHMTRVPEPTLADIMGQPKRSFVLPVEAGKEPTWLKKEIERRESERKEEIEQELVRKKKKEPALEKKEVSPEKPKEPQPTPAEPKESKEEEEDGDLSGYESAEEGYEEEIENVMSDYKNLAQTVQKYLPDVTIQDIYNVDLQQAQGLYQQAQRTTKEAAKLQSLQKAVITMQDVLQRLLDNLYSKYFESAQLRLSMSRMLDEDRRQDLQGDLNLVGAFYKNAQAAEDFETKVQQLEKAVARLKAIVAAINTVEQAARKQGD